MLELKNVTKIYGSFMALDDLSLTVDDGALFGFVGPNGAGKTTALRIMAGLLRPDSGEVVFGASPANGDPASTELLSGRAAGQTGRLIQNTGYIPDTLGIYRNLKVSEYMEFFAACSGLEGLEARKRIETLLEQVGLSDRDDFYVEALSRGMKQRLSLARALIGDPPVLLMDEPTSGLDPGTRYEFKRLISSLSEAGKTIVISSHILSDISEICTDVAIIDRGKLVISGRLSDVMNRVTAGNPLVISVDKNVTGAVQLLRNDNRVESVTVKGNDILISFGGLPEEESGLLKKLVDGGIRVRSFARQKGSLESIFLQLTGGQDRIVSSSDDYDE